MFSLKKIISVARLIRTGFWDFKYQLVLLTFLGFAGGFLASIGIGAAIPLFSIATGQAVPGTDLPTRIVTVVLNILHLPVHPAFLMLLIVALFTGKAVAQFFSKFTSDKLVARYIYQRQTRLFARTTRASWPYLLEQKVGHLERVLLFDIVNGANILGNVSSGILVLTSFLMYATVAVSISLKLTILTVVFGACTFLVTKPVFYRTRKLYEKVGILHKTIGHFIAESTIGAKVIKVMDSQDAVVRDGTGYFENLRRASVMGAFYNYLVTVFLEPVSYLFIAVLFLISYRAPGFNIAAFAVVMYLIQKLFYFTQQVQGQLQNVSGSVPYLQSALKFQREADAHPERDAGTAPFRFSRELACNGVSFGYPEKPAVLSDVSFTVPRGGMLGIIGPSGSGKTTLVDLLLRLFDPSQGTISADGTDIRSMRLADWRAHIGYVPQETFLLNASVEENIRFYDDSISDTDIQRAVQSAQLTDVIADLPDGIRTVVGERGIKLSGGQRQRIALARALARKPDILILDEATSSLDTASEERIQEAIHGLKGNITIIAIAHRLSTIMNADHVIVLENGRIARQGTPESVTA